MSMRRQRRQLKRINRYIVACHRLEKTLAEFQEYCAEARKEIARARQYRRAFGHMFEEDQQ